MIKTWKPTFYFFGLLLILISNQASYGQNDKVIIKNGQNEDVIRGTIKVMDKNTLTMSTGYGRGDFKVNWSRVNQVFSKRLFLITLSNGKVLNASINSDTVTNDGRMLLWYFTGEDTVQTNKIVYIKALEKDFWGRLNVSLSVGYSLARQNNLQQLSIRSNVGYLSNFWALSGSFDALRSTQDGVEPLSRTNAQASLEYYLQYNFFLLLSTNFLQNDDQLLELRAASSAGIGNYLVRSNKLQLSTSVGAVWNNEQYTGDGLKTRNSMELFVGAEANLFNIGNLNFLTSVILYPSLTEKNRRRTDLKVDLRYNLPLNFYIKFGYTLNYDNQPVEGGVEDDYVLQTTVGWSL